MFALRNLKSGATIRSLMERPLSQLKTGSSFSREISLLTEVEDNDSNQQMFTVGGKNGFLPRQEPLAELPKKYSALESLLQRMPMQLPDGTPGLLASGQFGDAVREELPVYDVDSLTDQRLLSGKIVSIKLLNKNFILCEAN